MKKYIYKITNIVNGKCYIGQSKDARKRIQGHILSLRKNKHDNRYLQFAWNKYGEENFKFEIIDYTEDYNEKEKYYIQFYDSTNHDKGYNILPGGENPPIGSHATLSKEDVEKIKNMLLDQYSINDIHNIFSNITKGQIKKINNGSSWRDKTLQYPLKKKNDSEIGKDVADSIIQDLLNGFLTQKEIAKKHSVSRTCVTAINQGKVEKYYNQEYKYPLRSTRCIGNICDDPEVVNDIIKELIETDLSMNKLAEKYTVSSYSIYAINKGLGRYYRENVCYPIRG